MAFEIRGERDLFVAMEAARGDDEVLFEGVRFVEWPRFEVTIEGRAFEGGVPTRVMPALWELQRALRRAYARSVYGDEKARLTREDRQRTELVFELADGSTKVVSDLLPVLNELAGKLSGRASVALILALAFIFKGDDYLRAYLDYRVALLEAGPVIEAAQGAEARESLSGWGVENEDIFRLQEDVDKAHTRLLLNLEDDDELVFDRKTRVRGYDARRLARQTRRTGERSTVEGEYIVQSVQSGQIRDGFRAKIRGVRNDDVLWVIISETRLTESQIDHLQKSGVGEAASSHDDRRSPGRYTNLACGSDGLGSSGGGGRRVTRRPL